MYKVGDLVWYCANKHKKIPARPDKGAGIITKVWENKYGNLLYRVRWQLPEYFTKNTKPWYHDHQLVNVITTEEKQLYKKQNKRQ